MSSHQLDEERIFHLARKIPDSNDRSEYLDQVCVGDIALSKRVEALLQVHEKEQEFLKSGSPPPEETVDHKPILEGPGISIGRYKLMEQIGEGGMGVVFVAEQEKPIRRKVALKVIKPGMDSKAVVARFEAERQALAMMDHPNIAKVLDAGTTDSGRPYFAMELVKGIPITDYCDKNKLSIPERLELFISVCQAIQHAHQKGIIHRDIKPSNVLITLHDGKPVPKVIDFGVAKAVNARLTDRTIYTEHFQIVGTLLYMSPEQAELSGLDIDTRSDIYSLGVLLYELLTGTTPFQKKELDEAGFDEKRRIIREQEPPRASVRISSLGETATAVAEHRKTDPKRLNQIVQGDLDWIVLKAMEKDRIRRYETATSFANDICRYLNDDLVQARPPSSVYRVTKFIRRNRVMTASALLVTVSIALGVAGVIVQARIAEMEAARANDTLSRLRDLAFRQAQLAALSGNRRETIAAQKIAREAGASELDLMVLDALVHYATGDFKSAHDTSHDILTVDTNNFVAQAIYTKTSIQAGLDDEFPMRMAKLRKLRQIKEELRPLTDEELLLLAATEIMDEPRKALTTLRLVSDDQHSPLKLAIQSEALCHCAWLEENLETCRNSIRGFQKLEVIVGANLNTQTHQLLALTYGAELARREATGEDVELLDQAEQAARWLSRDEVSSTLESSTSRWHYHRANHDRLKAWKAIKPLAAYDGTWSIFLAADRLGSDESLQDAKDQFDSLYQYPKRSDKYIRLGRAYLVHGLAEEREFVRRTALELAQEETALLRKHGVYLLCLLGEKDEAERHAEQILQDTNADGLFEVLGERKCLEHLAGRGSGEQLVESASDSGVHRCVALFTLAMQRMAEGQDAYDELLECASTRSIFFFEHFLAEAMLSRLKASRNPATPEEAN